MTNIDQERAELLRHFVHLAHYWAKTGQDKLDACNGLIFSVLVAIDGCSLEAPSVKLLTYDGRAINDLHDAWHEVWARTEPVF